MKANKKRMRRKILISVSILVVLVISAILMYEIHRMRVYNEAVELMNQGQLNEANDRFYKLHDYRDSMALYYCCRAKLDAERENYSIAYLDLCFVRDKYRLPASRYPEFLNEELLNKIDAGYDAYMRERSAKAMADMIADSARDARKNQKKTSQSTKKRSTSTPKPEDDPLNARSYANPEDFYDDNYYDFFDYEEAEDYYYEHGGR